MNSGRLRLLQCDARKEATSSFSALTYFQNAIDDVTYNALLQHIVRHRKTAQTSASGNPKHSGSRIAPSLSVRQLELFHDRSSVRAMVKKAKYYLEGNKDAALALFRKIAREGDGELDPKQFSSALHLLGLDVSGSDFQKLWTYLDVNGDDKISPEELISGLDLNLDGNKAAELTYRNYSGWKRPDPPPLFKGVDYLPVKWPKRAEGSFMDRLQRPSPHASGSSIGTAGQGK